MPTGNQNSLIKKASAQNGAKALKIMRFLGLVASQGGLFHLPENTFLKKKCCKSVAKAVVQKVPSPEKRINTGFLRRFILFPLVAESHNLTFFAYKPCDVVFVLF